MPTLRVKAAGLDDLIRDLHRTGQNPRQVMRGADQQVATMIDVTSTAVARTRQMRRTVKSNTYKPSANGIEVQIGARGAPNSSDLSWSAAAQQGSPYGHGFLRQIRTTYTVDRAVRDRRSEIADPWLEALAEAIEK